VTRGRRFESVRGLPAPGVRTQSGLRVYATGLWLRLELGHPPAKIELELPRRSQSELAGFRQQHRRLRPTQCCSERRLCRRELLFARPVRLGHRPSFHSAATGPAHRAGSHRHCGERCRRVRGSSRTEGKSAVHPRGRLIARRSSGNGASGRFLSLVPCSSLIGDRNPLEGL